MFEAIAASGAAGDGTHGHFVDESSVCGGTTSPLQELLSKGFVCKMTLLEREDHQLFTLTDAGRAFVKPSVKVEHPIPLLRFKRPGIGLDFWQHTTLELIFHLASEGWMDQEHTKSKTLPPYMANGDKIWYKPPGSRISHLYLHALAVADDRFKSGCIVELHHFQPQAYYRAIIDGLIGITPNQPLAFYKLLHQRNQQLKNLPTTDSADKNMEEQPPSAASAPLFEVDEVGHFPAVLGTWEL